LRDPLITLVKNTELNSVVIDIKDYSGEIAFRARVPDMKEFIQKLHDNGIYVIGRVAVFQDTYFVKKRPDLAVTNKSNSEVWRDHKGISWIDPGSRQYWDYIISIAKEAHDIGFDEINFDYIRYPSDGNMQNISYPESKDMPKSEVIKQFFSYLHDHLQGTGLVISADLFGLTTSAKDDMGIGQILENALPYFDFIDPMVYPSHFASGFQGFSDPEAHPYEVVQYSMQSAIERVEFLASTTGQNKEVYKNKLRPWLQDFGLRQDYGPTEVRAEIKATYDVGLSSWLLWSASNKYTIGALESK
jgi:hypothetical protein